MQRAAALVVVSGVLIGVTKLIKGAMRCVKAFSSGSTYLARMENSVQDLKGHDRLHSGACAGPEACSRQMWRRCPRMCL
jgi:hypothetical protein